MFPETPSRPQPSPRPSAVAPQPQGPLSRARYEQAYRSVAHEIARVPPESLMLINLDVVRAVITVRGVLPGIRALRPELEATFRAFDPAAFDRLETYALALFHLNARYRMATAPVEPLTALVERATALRDIFVADMTPLAKRGLMSETALRNRPRGQGFRNLVDELYALVAELRASWERVRGRTGVQLAELEEAERLVDRITIGLGRRQQGPSASATAVALERQQAFTLFMKAYEALRRQVLYLRPDLDEADALAPSLYAGRGGRRRAAPRVEPGPIETTFPTDFLAPAPAPDATQEPAPALTSSLEPFAPPPPFTSPSPVAARAASPKSRSDRHAPAFPAFPALARLGAEDPFGAH